MVERAKKAIVELLVATKEISEGEAWDIVKETQSVVNDTLAGETTYKSPDEVVWDYLGLCQDYTWVFLYDDEDNDPTVCLNH